MSRHNAFDEEIWAADSAVSLSYHIHTYIHTTKFIERQNREERIGGAAQSD